MKNTNVAIVILILSAIVLSGCVTDKPFKVSEQDFHDDEILGMQTYEHDGKYTLSKTYTKRIYNGIYVKAQMKTTLSKNKKTGKVTVSRNTIWR